MKKKSILLIAALLIFSCISDKKEKLNIATTKLPTVIEYNSNQQEKHQAAYECEFKNDEAVLQYLTGKTFRQKNGNITIKFSYDGAVLSGNMRYQWVSYRSMGGYKGVVKLASLNSTNPNGTITLYVSCKENSVTDGKIVLQYN
ncbi:MAG: hypothetical protein JKY08_07855 [Flavobacteriaceae bacterium]|nr:hypothetical protein [Flavobacteriaceae bacterium]